MSDLTYVPNQIPVKTRIWNVCLSVGLLTYGAYGLYTNDLFIPGKRSRGVHLHDAAAWVMFAAMICAVLNLLAVVVDHYDRRDNERRYHDFAKLTQIGGWILFTGSLVLAIFRRQMT